MSAPFAEAAHAYKTKGWHVVPLPVRRKKSPPAGYTGYAGIVASGADLQEWIDNGKAGGNIALRMPETVLGLDLDDYDGKPGLATMLGAVDQLGPLPPSPRSTSRPDDPVSGIRFYRVPPGRRWADVLGSGVEVIHHGHRYAVAAPSVHPEGRMYGWYGAQNAPVEAPGVEELPVLPPAWVEHLDRGDVADLPAKARLDDEQTRAWLDALPPGLPCTYVRRLIVELAEQIEGAASRHDMVRGYIARMVRAGDQGHTGVPVALDTAESLFEAQRALSDPFEVARMVTGAIAMCVADPCGVFDKGCCPPELQPWPVIGDHPVHDTGDHPVHDTSFGDAASDDAAEAAMDAAASFALEVTREAYRLRVREAARSAVEADKADTLDLPPLTRLDVFLAVPDEPVTHRIAGLWPTGGRVVLSAPHKAGKSTLTGNLARSLVDAVPFLGRFTVEPVRRVILLDNELDERMLRRWLRDQGIANTEAVDLVPLRGRLSSFNILDPATRQRWAEHIGPGDVLIFDCMRPALDALGLSEDKEAGRFLEAMDELTTQAGVSELLVVHHMGHANERSRGDSRILDWPDSLWKLVRDAEDDEDTAQSRRYFTAYGRDVEQPEVLLSFDQASRHLSVAGGSRTEAKAEGVLVQVLDYLAEHPGAPKSGVEKALGGRAENVRKALDSAVTRGLVEREKRGNAYFHTLSTRPLVPDPPDEWTNALVHSSIGTSDECEGRDDHNKPTGRDESSEPNPPRRSYFPAALHKQPTSGPVGPEVGTTCWACGQVPTDKAGIGSTGLCLACDMREETPR